MNNVKKVAVYSGLVLVWAGGMLLAYKAGEVVVDGIAKVCSKASYKLLAFL